MVSWTLRWRASPRCRCRASRSTPSPDPSGQVDDPEDTHPRGGELDGQGHAVEAPAQLADDIEVAVVDLHAAVASAFAEQAYRAGASVERAGRGDR